MIASRMTSPLSGLRVAVVVLGGEPAAALGALRSAGAKVTELELERETDREELRPLERAATELALFDWLVVSSPEMADAVLSRAGGALPDRLRVAVQGAPARRVLAGYEVEPALTVAEEGPSPLVSALSPYLGRCERVLVPHPTGADAADLVRGLEAAGAEAVPVPAGSGQAARWAPAAEPLGWVVFPSARCVPPLARLLGESWAARRGTLSAVAFGEETAQALDDAGVADVLCLSGLAGDGWVGDLAAALEARAAPSPLP